MCHATAFPMWQVREFFKAHGLVYRESNLIECVKYNIKALEFAHLLE